MAFNVWYLIPQDVIIILNVKILVACVMLGQGTKI